MSRSAQWLESLAFVVMSGTVLAFLIWFYRGSTTTFQKVRALVVLAALIAVWIMSLVNHLGG